MTLGIALIIYMVFLACYWFFVWSIYWHVREYTMPQDHSKGIVQSFMVSIIILSLLSTALFFTLPFVS